MVAGKNCRNLLKLFFAESFFIHFILYNFFFFFPFLILNFEIRVDVIMKELGCFMMCDVLKLLNKCHVLFD